MPVDRPCRLFLTSRIEIHIRQAEPADAPILAQFNLQLAAESEHLQLDPARVRAGVRAVLSDATKGCYFVAETDGRIIGQLMITYEWSDWRNGNIWWIQSVFVREEFRRQGVFPRLFQHVHHLAGTRQDVCSLRLYVHGDNARARRAYERLGMKRTAYEIFELELPLPAPPPPGSAGNSP